MCCFLSGNLIPLGTGMTFIATSNLRSTLSTRPLYQPPLYLHLDLKIKPSESEPIILPITSVILTVYFTPISYQWDLERKNKELSLLGMRTGKPTDKGLWSQTMQVLVRVKE